MSSVDENEKAARDLLPPPGTEEPHKETLIEQPPFNEDFIIVENPDFISNQNSISQPLAFTELVNGVENDVLPPPRTLDDFPVRKRKRKDNMKQTQRKRSNVGRKETVSKSLGSMIIEEIDKIETSNQTDKKESDQSIIDVDEEEACGSAPDSGISKTITITSNNGLLTFTGDEDSDLINPYSSYNLRKKCANTDYNVDGIYSEEIIEESFLCLECHLCFETSDSLRNHQITVHDHQTFACQDCGRDFSSAVGLKRHFLLKHKQNKCSLCNKNFRSKQKLHSHMETCRKNLITDVKQEKKPKLFPCPECGRSFTLSCNLRRHMKLHKGILEFSCDYCEKKCSEKHALDSHVRYMHTGERPYKCEICFKSFTTNSDLRRHKTVHSDERKFICTNCGKGFKTRDGLKAHMKLESGEKLWQCGVCSHRCVTKSDLKAHMVKHSSIKIYECETCQISFSHQQSLDSHMLVHSGLMPFVCQHCGKKFAHVQNRNRHIKSMHKEEEVM